jgi:hypothetical protein
MPDGVDEKRAPDPLDEEAAQGWRDVEPELYDPGVSGSILFEPEVLDGELLREDDDFDDDDDGAGVEDVPMHETGTEYVPALYDPDIEGYDPAMYEPPAVGDVELPRGAAELAADKDRLPEESDYASELVRTRAVLLRLEQTVARDLTMLAEQIEAINHRISALEQDHDAIREWIDGAPDDGTADLRAMRALVRALNHRMTAIERGSK